MATKTYLLAPNFTYHPSTSICLGSIIQDPSDPTKPLSSLPPSVPAPPTTTTHLDLDVRISSTTSSSLQGSIFAKFLEVVEARLGGGISSNVLDAYTIDRLETIYFTKQPTDEEAAARVKEPKVNAAVNSGAFGKKYVYMITGLKVARGLRAESGHAGGWTADAGVGGVLVASAAGLEVGAQVEGGRERSTEISYTVGEDVVFAYQLHVLKHKGLRGKYVDISVYKPAVAFLNEEGETVGVEEVEAAVASEDDIRGFDVEMPVTVMAAKDGDEPCVCIVFDEE